MATSKNALDLDGILAKIDGDEGLRQGLIRVLARDFPRDYLSPARLATTKGRGQGGQITVEPVSCKEWQE